MAKAELKTTELNLYAHGDKDRAERVRILEKFNNTIGIEELRLLEKSCIKHKTGINEKIKKYANFLT